ncbi:hypothetical protein YW5DRAFT_06519 [Streptomyces sp. Ncost-T6T-1]|uniref:hypothetical protein n=1 Tax=Streptomyces sp. Ncost-T6T-1 TaxID=1100828 RepID=UPI0008048C6C|nr:hypothetical protein [Streptomyces sp. Ncost-T6T-1]SBV01108.1 hypothetical protein YW5DRAFT_06519 [Streptomyces sp. Ncost-T6T-1]
MDPEIMREMKRTADPALLEIAYGTSDVDGAADAGGEGHEHHHPFGDAIVEVAAFTSLLSMGSKAVARVRQKYAGQRAGTAGGATAVGSSVGAAPAPSPEALPQAGGDAARVESRSGRAIPDAKSGIPFDEMVSFARHCLVVHYGKSIQGELVYVDDYFEPEDMDWGFEFSVAGKGGSSEKRYQIILHENADTVMPVNYTCTLI